MSVEDGFASDVVWVGRPWVLPRILGDTVVALVAATVLTWVELALLKLNSLLIVLGTYGVIAIFWFVAVATLELVKASNEYTLRGSSLEIRHGIVGRRILTISAAGFSDLEVTKTLAGRILNMGDIRVETDSDRDVRLQRVRDPIKVSAMIRQVMTVPVVRVASQPQTRVA